MIEMRLVKVPARKSDIDPIDHVPLFDHPDDLLKALDPAKEFWRQPDFVTKHLNEPSLAEIDRLRHRGAREQTWVALKLLHREGHRRVMFQWPACNLHQPFFKNPKLHFDRSCFVKTTEQPGGSSFSPKIGQSHVETM